jgi:hypothetical protein
VERDDHEDVVLVALHHRGRVDLHVVEVLARLRLVAHRGGLHLTLTDPPAELLELLTLTGLAELLTSRCQRSDTPGSALEPRRQPEVGEALGVQEVVEPRDRPV